MNSTSTRKFSLRELKKAKTDFGLKRTAYFLPSSSTVF